MSIKNKNNIFIWIILGALVLVIGYLKWQDSQKVSQIRDPLWVDERSLLPLPIENIAALEIGYQGNLHRFDRDSQGTWFYHAHGGSTGVMTEHGHVADVEAGDAIAKFLVGLNNARIERFLETDEKSAYGVINPSLILLAYKDAEGSPLAQYAFGDQAPDGLSRYVLIVGRDDVVLIADYQHKNLIDLVDAAQSMVAPPPSQISND